MHSSRPAPQEVHSGSAEVHRYSIRNLLFVTAGIGCWCALFQMLPHLAIFVSGIILAAISTALWARNRRLAKGRVSGLAVLLFAVTSWLYFYIVSIGPAIRINGEYHDRRDIMVVYAPVGWLHAATPLRKPLDEYAKWWSGR